MTLRALTIGGGIFETSWMLWLCTHWPEGVGSFRLHGCYDVVRTDQRGWDFLRYWSCPEVPISQVSSGSLPQVVTCNAWRLVWMGTRRQGCPGGTTLAPRPIYTQTQRRIEHQFQDHPYTWQMNNRFHDWSWLRNPATRCWLMEPVSMYIIDRHDKINDMMCRSITNIALQQFLINNVHFEYQKAAMWHEMKCCIICKGTSQHIV